MKPGNFPLVGRCGSSIDWAVTHAAARPYSLYFDVDELDSCHKAEVLRELGTASSHAKTSKLAEQRSGADAVIILREHGIGAGQVSRAVANNEYVWSAGDLPSGYNRGLYCSLPRALFDRTRHDSYCYPIRYNEQVAAFDLSDAQQLFSFVGGVTSGIRARMVEHFTKFSGDWEVRVSAGPWNAMFDRSGTSIKRQYAESIRRSKFVLCPRGNGVSSIRLFEAMEASRVPVIISDAYVPPSGIDWHRCAIFVRESEFDNIPEILRQCEGEWEQRAAAARCAWETHFSPRVWLDAIADRVAKIKAGKAEPSLAGRARLGIFRVGLALRRAAPRFFPRLLAAGS